MLVQNILEFSRLMWNKRCTIVQNEREFTFGGRIRKKNNHLCLFLQQHSDFLPENKHHLIKNPLFFDQQPFANIEMWKRHIDIVLDPTYTPQKSKITQHFRKPPPLLPRQRKRKQTEETCPVKEKKKKQSKYPSVRYQLTF